MKSEALTFTPKILLVDDNHDGLVVRKLLLEEVGCQVEVASGGEEAIRLFSSGTFDVVVTDYRMPLMNGTELIQKIRAVQPQARIILLSGFVEPLGLNEQNTGADAVVCKNSREPAYLVRCVKRLMNGSRRKPPSRQPATTVRGTLRQNLAH